MFDSMPSCVWVFSGQRARYDMAQDVDTASNNAAFLDMVQLPRSDLVCAQWRVLGPLCPVFVVARDHDMRWLVVTVRGTLSTKDRASPRSNVRGERGISRKSAHTHTHRARDMPQSGPGLRRQVEQVSCAPHPSQRLKRAEKR